MEKEVHEINQKQAIAQKREQKITAIQLKQEEIQKKKLREEEIIAKKSDSRTKIAIYITCFVLGIIIAVPLMKKDPVQFWFVVIVIICSAGKVLISENNKRK